MQIMRDIYNSLSELKGSALKVAQMMSMDKNLLPSAYQDKFAMAQYSAPPLSYPLVVKTFQQYFKKLLQPFLIPLLKRGQCGFYRSSTQS